MPYVMTPNGPVFVSPTGKKTEEKPTTKADKVGLSDKSILIMDRGLKTYLAPFMARYFGTVYYHCIVGGPYLDSPTASIGSGIPNVIHTTRPGEIIRTVPDITVFYPDIYDGDMQEMLRHFGVAVCGPGRGEVMEMDKLAFHSALDVAELPTAPMKHVKGLDGLLDYTMRHEGPFFAKLRDHYRADWETTRMDDIDDAENLIASKRDKLGAKRAAEMEFLCYDPIESECEGGIDGFRLGGKLANLISCGYEMKDKAYVTKVMDSVPKIFQPELDGLAPVYDGMGFAGPWSNEVRITKDGTAYPIDQTCRCGEPPTAVFCELLGESYAVAIYQLARGQMPTLDKTALYGAQINLCSDYYGEDNELYVNVPEEIEQWVKLQNYTMKDGKRYIIPNENGCHFGAVVAVGNTLEEATDKAMERVKMIQAREMHYGENCFDRLQECITAGRKFGINL